MRESWLSGVWTCDRASWFSISMDKRQCDVPRMWLTEVTDGQTKSCFMVDGVFLCTSADRRGRSARPPTLQLGWHHISYQR